MFSATTIEFRGGLQFFFFFYYKLSWRSWRNHLNEDFGLIPPWFSLPSLCNLQGIAGRHSRVLWVRAGCLFLYLWPWCCAVPSIPTPGSPAGRSSSPGSWQDGTSSLAWPAGSTFLSSISIVIIYRSSQLIKCTSASTWAPIYSACRPSGRLD